MTDHAADERDGSEYPPYPHTPEECRHSFIANARSIEERLFGLSQDIYGEVAQVWNENPPTHTEIAARIKKVLDEGLATISADFLAAPALVADKAWGYPVAGPGEGTGLPHT
ncbi:MAG TPA: hypothetical protein VF885_26855 [Arthrobacter sp.]